MKKIYTKIYGERNSGTNYLSKLIEANFETILLLGGRMPRPAIVDLHHSITEFQRPGLSHNELLDIEHKRTLLSEFGWKHCAPPIDVINNAPHKDLTLFIAIAKHPAFWARSLLKRPYNPQGVKRVGFSEFIRHPWSMAERDNLGDAEAGNPIAMWAAKVARYMDLARVTDDFIKIRYEDLILDTGGHLDEIGRFLRKKHDEAYQNPHGAVKIDDEPRAIEFYRRKYDLASLPEQFEEADLAFIHEQVPAGVLEFFGYERP